MSDFHGVFPLIPKIEGEYDFICVSGDNAPHFKQNWDYNDYFERMLNTKKEAEDQKKWIKNEMIPFLSKISCKNSPIVINGNHDFGDYTDLFENYTFQDPKNITLDGIKFGLLPGMVKTSGFWSDEITEDEFDRRIHELDSDTQILISHSPPKAVLDMDNGNRWGSDSIYKSIFGLSGMTPYFSSLRCHFFGHVHDSENSRIEHEIDDRKVIFINAACKVVKLEIDV